MCGTTCSSPVGIKVQNHFNSILRATGKLSGGHKWFGPALICHMTGAELALHKPGAGEHEALRTSLPFPPLLIPGINSCKLGFALHETLSMRIVIATRGSLYYWDRGDK